MKEKLLKKYKKKIKTNCKTHPLLIKTIVKILIKYSSFHGYPSLDSNYRKSLKRKTLN